MAETLAREATKRYFKVFLSSLDEYNVLNLPNEVCINISIIRYSYFANWFFLASLDTFTLFGTPTIPGLRRKYSLLLPYRIIVSYIHSSYGSASSFSISFVSFSSPSLLFWSQQQETVRYPITENYFGNFYSKKIYRRPV